LNGLVGHLEEQVATAHEVVIHQLDVLWRRVGVQTHEEVEDLRVVTLPQIFYVLVKLELLEEFLILVQCFHVALTESQLCLVADLVIIVFPVLVG